MCVYIYTHTHNKRAFNKTLEETLEETLEDKERERERERKSRRRRRRRRRRSFFSGVFFARVCSKWMDLCVDGSAPFL